MNDISEQEREVLQSSIASLRASVMAVVFGMVGGAGLFVATVWLLIKGGPQVGRTLSLLGHYYPGYSVSWGGSLVGFFYGAVTGAIIGYSVARLYNLFARRKGS